MNYSNKKNITHTISDSKLNLKDYNQYKPAQYIEDILKGDITSLSKAITIIESTSAKHQRIAQELIQLCLPYSGKSIRIGITGVPGVGKSTFIEAFGKLLTAKNKRVAVLSIDPSSTLGKGSILGDKTRMSELSADTKAFIRPTPSGDSLGGVANKTRETILLCEAAGFDVIIVETVGVGQNEIAVHSMVDFFLLLSLAGAGDELQGIKKGIVEMADAFVINKDDGDNTTRVKLAKADLERALHLFPTKDSGIYPKVFTCSALNKTGINEIWNEITAFETQTKANGNWLKKRIKQNETWFTDSIKNNLLHLLNNNKEIKLAFNGYTKMIQSNLITPLSAANELIDQFIEQLKK